MKNYSINLLEMGQRIKALRTKQRKTQEYFADILYISPSYLALIENGKRTATIDVLAQVAKTCDVDMDYLLFGKPSEYYDHAHQKLQRLIDSYSKDRVEKALALAEYYLVMETSQKC